MAQKNYLLINRSGEHYHFWKTRFENALGACAYTEGSTKTNSYIHNVVKYDGQDSAGFKLNFSTWKTLSNNISSNTNRIALCNALCDNIGHTIEKVIYNHHFVFPAETHPGVITTTVKNYFFKTKSGKYFTYTKGGENISLSDALKAHIIATLGYNEGFAVSANVWNIADDAISDDFTRIQLFNKLCKRTSDQIEVAAANATNIYPRNKDDSSDIGEILDTENEDMANDDK